MDKKRKQPREELDFDFDASRRMVDDEMVIGATITCTGPDDALIVLGYTIVADATRVKVWVKDGTDGATYKLTCLADTNGGRKIEREFLLAVKED